MTHPVVQLLTISSRMVLTPPGSAPSTESSITEEEIKILIDQGTQDGIFAEAEKDIVKSVFRLADREVGQVDDASLRYRLAGSGHLI